MGKKDKLKTAEDPWAPADDTAKPKKDKAPKPAVSSSGADFGLSGPGSGGNFTPKDHVDKLLLITPTQLRDNVSTSYGESEAMEADIVVLDRSNPADSEEINGGLIFQKVLIGQLREAEKKRTRVVGTLIVDTASQKKGQSAPYRLTAPTDADIDVARKYLDALNPLR